MKHAYVSVVLPVATPPSREAITRLDAVLKEKARAHEVIVVVPHSAVAPNYAEATSAGPVSVVATHLRASRDGAVVAGLARAVGDFVIEWRAPVDALGASELHELLEPTNSGAELVEMTGLEDSWASRRFNRMVNRLRPAEAPVRKTVARAFSRRAVGALLAATAFEPQIDILVAELPVHRTVRSRPLSREQRDGMVQRFGEGLTLLSKGTRFGSVIPLSLAAVSAAFGVAAAVYALAILVLRGQAPEGWTTLMVVVGMGQAAILAMLGLTWTRIDALARGLSRNSDATAETLVWAPAVPPLVAADQASPEFLSSLEEDSV